MTITIETITDTRLGELMVCDSLSERFSAVVMQSHYVEICAVSNGDTHHATMTVNAFHDGFDGVYNLTDFTENYDRVAQFSVLLVDGMNDAAVVTALVAHAVTLIAIDLSA